MAISVCMAAYNGEKFIARQLESILIQLAAEDEVVIVDDCSTDCTVDVVRGLGDSRIALHSNDRNRREVYSFGRAIELARNEVIFLSDHDDIWVPGRAAVMESRLRQANAALVTSNFSWMDFSEKPLSIVFDGVRSADSGRHTKNIADIFIGKTNYFGCAMAFQRSLVPLITPIPAYVESHDLWIALAANLIGSNLHIDDQTLRKRQHGNNATSTVSNRSLYRKLMARVIFVRSLIDLQARRRRLASQRDTTHAGGAR